MADCEMNRSFARRMRQSAGTMSPAASRMMSPATMSVMGRSRMPSGCRMTAAVLETILASHATARSLRASWMKRSNPDRKIMTAITLTVMTSRAPGDGRMMSVNTEMQPMTARMAVNGLTKACARRRPADLSRPSPIRLSPKRARFSRTAASPDNPAGEEPYCRIRSSAGMAAACNSFFSICIRSVLRAAMEVAVLPYMIASSTGALWMDTIEAKTGLTARPAKPVGGYPGYVPVCGWPSDRIELQLSESILVT